MAPRTEHPTPLETVRRLRQLRHLRGFYLMGFFLWAVSTAWTGWEAPGSRQMWAAVFLLSVFTGLLVMASLWVRRLEKAGPARPQHHAARRRAPAPHQAST
ncbi:hypothetical protein [Streptomyces sp. NPDC048392]|uniref:hypothetical protein n=1 Tax=Streptomyces sp. NPDC048392 TaxID=3365543 RepID=UPI00371075A7